MRSDGLETWNAPAAMNRMWSVLSIPYLVFTVVPSIIGRMSRCTPSRLTSGPCPPSRPQTLSISSMKMMPDCSTRSTAWRETLSMSISFCSSSCTRYLAASDTFTRRFLLRPWNNPGSISLTLMSISSIDEPAITSNEGDERSRTSTSTLRSSNFPACNWMRNFSLVLFACSRAAETVASSPTGCVGGRRRSSKRSSAACCALSRTSTRCSSRTISTASPARSRIIDSTSRPT